jgi:hypothetical protein
LACVVLGGDSDGSFAGGVTDVGKAATL